MPTPDQDEPSASASFAHSLSVAPLNTANTINNISIALGGSAHIPLETDSDMLMMDPDHALDTLDQHQHHNNALQPESRIAVAELLVSLAQNSTQVPDESTQNTTIGGPSGSLSPTRAVAPMLRQSPIYRNAVDYVGSVKKAYENNPQVNTEFLDALEKYHTKSMPIEQLVRTVMALFQDQPDLLMGFKEFLPEAQGLLNQLVPPMMYSDYKGRQGTSQARQQTTIPTAYLSAPAGFEQNMQQQGMNNIHQILNNGQAAADFLSLIKERSQQEPDMYQHMITLLRKFQKDHSYSNLYFYVSIILRYHPHLLQRFHNFLPTVTSGIEVTEPRIISKAPPEELVVSPDFIEAKDFVQTVKFTAKTDMSMYDRFIFALEKYQRTGWTIDQVYSEVSLIFWNHPDALAGFKQFISTVPQEHPPQP